MPRQFTIEEEQALIAAAQAGDQAARDTIVADHAWLIKKVAKRYSRIRVDMRPELIQAGVAGLLDALDRAEARPDHRFSGFAVWYIIRDVRDAALASGAIVRAPKGRFGVPHASLNEPIGLGDEGDKTERIDLLASDTPSPEDNVGADPDRQRVRAAVAALPDRECEVIEQRFLAEDRTGLVALGSEVGVSHEGYQATRGAGAAPAAGPAAGGLTTARTAGEPSRWRRL